MPERGMADALAGLLVGGLLAAGNAVLAAPGDASALHAAHCSACHASLGGGDATALYTREGRQVRDIAALGQRVASCARTTGRSWSDQELRELTDFLNREYYRFP